MFGGQELFAHLMRSEALDGFADKSTFVTGVDSRVASPRWFAYYWHFDAMSITNVRLAELSV